MHIKLLCDISAVWISDGDNESTHPDHGTLSNDVLIQEH